MYIVTGASDHAVEDRVMYVMYAGNQTKRKRIKIACLCTIPSTCAYYRYFVWLLVVCVCILLYVIVRNCFYYNLYFVGSCVTMKYGHDIWAYVQYQNRTISLRRGYMAESEGYTGWIINPDCDSRRDLLWRYGITRLWQGHILLMPWYPWTHFQNNEPIWTNSRTSCSTWTCFWWCISCHIERMCRSNIRSV